MFAIFKREVRSFFTSPIGYLIVGSFLLLNGLFLWVFKNEYNIFDYGFADLGNFFLLAPWIFVFLVPAITMKSFSEERKMGTLELLLIKPISIWKLVLGKFWGALLLCIIAVVPTLVYVFAISKLGMVEGNYDLGVVLGSYFGLLFLMACYTSIGIFASTLSDNQIIAFLVGILVCFLIFNGFDAIATLFSDGETQQTVQSLGAKAHFDSIARGVIDTRDLVYFISLTLVFLHLTFQRLKQLPR
ncbi:MAG: gliding motility-associated ABC transporter permease subunit GldF [Allomuricauda sp.]|uniref:gliding motility-associated ABC transporter permease subunit GldF n=1 Tax=Flagellimonas sp. TaxID=2058762 RepID=UPI001B0EBB31|nr:gliding motility-associated ABC transporter permease subunit GldF [Allomuricauda sp.]MBO6533877.1 gliding motility-associated ABC transporter permease subunit GldF [Allomuricauda sp.]MBO6589805.1 gliding motility-associated ABC transporter permease subunit GldF [Allomuricauda sp.]MBO6619262.1 gliding motility-associated ABC transporter permease subunit GldF [Allomuricauda sp.]MBO6645173.1 gliding motility-associated ABC transporter permease subunit GldF [Allomuricauda sp.]MBO6747551.1 glidi